MLPMRDKRTNEQQVKIELLSFLSVNRWVSQCSLHPNSTPCNGRASYIRSVFEFPPSPSWKSCPSVHCTLWEARRKRREFGNFKRNLNCETVVQLNEVVSPDSGSHFGLQPRIFVILLLTQAWNLESTDNKEVNLKIVLFIFVTWVLR